MTANDSHSCLGYYNKLVDEYNNSWKTFWYWLLFWLKKIESRHVTPKFKVGDRVRITTYKHMFRKG